MLIYAHGRLGILGCRQSCLTWAGLSEWPVDGLIGWGQATCLGDPAPLSWSRQVTARSKRVSDCHAPREWGMGLYKWFQMPWAPCREAAGNQMPPGSQGPCPQHFPHPPVQHRLLLRNSTQVWQVAPAAPPSTPC